MTVEDLKKEQTREVENLQQTATLPVEKPTSAVATPKEYDNRGFEGGNDKEDMIIPRAKLLQGMSPEIKENPKEFYQGQVIDSVTLEVLNTEDEKGNILPIEIIPILLITEWMRFNPRKKEDNGFLAEYEPGALIWNTRNPDDPRVAESKFGPDGEKPVAAKYLNFLCCIKDNPMPLFFSFPSTNKFMRKAGKTLYTLARRDNMVSGRPLFGRKYKIHTKQESNGADTFFVFDVKPSGITEGDELKYVEKLYDNFKDKEIEVDRSESSVKSDKPGWDE